MTNAFWIGCGSIGFGLLLAGYPDQGPPAFSFNNDHGPSFSDLIGLFFVICGWAFMLLKTMFKGQRVIAVLGSGGITRMVFVICLGKFLIYLGLRWHTHLILWTGVGLSVLAYVTLFIPAFRRNND